MPHRHAPTLTPPTVTDSAAHPLKGRIICVDGPSSSGKGTLAKKLAYAYRLKFLDTGCLYRAVAHAMQTRGQDLSDVAACVAMAEALAQPGVFDFKHVGNNVFGVWAFGEEITEQIRTLDVGLGANVVAQHQPLRLALRTFQQDFATHWQGVYGVVLDGRDTGSKIAPQADLKLMLHGDPAVRAHWRLKDYVDAGKAATLDDVLTDLKTRDARDAVNMQAGPDTVRLDATAGTAADLLAKVQELIQARFDVAPVAGQ